jgi:hypothetical protein
LRPSGSSSKIVLATDNNMPDGMCFFKAATMTEASLVACRLVPSILGIALTISWMSGLAAGEVSRQIEDGLVGGSLSIDDEMSSIPLSVATPDVRGLLRRIPA